MTNREFVPGVHKPYFPLPFSLVVLIAHHEQRLQDSWIIHSEHSLSHPEYDHYNKTWFSYQGQH